MITITLVKFRRRPTKKELDRVPKVIQEGGGKVVSIYWTLGHYDAVATLEVPDERAAMKIWSQLLEPAATETLIAVPREEAIKLAGY